MERGGEREERRQRRVQQPEDQRRRVGRPRVRREGLVRLALVEDGARRKGEAGVALYPRRPGALAQHHAQHRRLRVVGLKRNRPGRHLQPPLERAARERRRGQQGHRAVLKVGLAVVQHEQREPWAAPSLHCARPHLLRWPAGCWIALALFFF